MRSDVIMATVMVQARRSHVVRREFSVVVRVRVLVGLSGTASRPAAGCGLANIADRGDGMWCRPRRWVSSGRRVGRVGQRSGCAGVLVEESAEEVDSFDRSLRVDFAGDGYWHIEADSAVRSSGVVMSDVHVQDVLQVPPVEDQRPV